MVKTGLVNVYTDYFKLSKKTLDDVLNEITDNKTLKAVLSYNFGDYGTMPKDVPFVMHAVLVK
jgi:all-trans-retinol 13,14-reductase